MNLGGIHRSLGHLDKARIAFGKASNLDPSDLSKSVAEKLVFSDIYENVEHIIKERALYEAETTNLLKKRTNWRKNDRAYQQICSGLLIITKAMTAYTREAGQYVPINFPQQKNICNQSKRGSGTQKNLRIGICSDYLCNHNWKTKPWNSGH